MKKKCKNINQLIEILKTENINTWFDLGLFLDKIKSNENKYFSNICDNKINFNKSIKNGGIGFITFQYSVDGVSLEINKYAEIFKKKFKNTPIHYITGKFYPESYKLLPNYVVKKEIKDIQGFNDWSLYKYFFFTKLDRGSKEYNELIKKFWNETILIIKELGKYIIDNNLSLLYLVNICSNPGNVSLALAIILLSEYFGLNIINNNHDFYWEGGNSTVKKRVRKLPNGPRDFFFMNSHLGEVFSIIEILYPWKSKKWINVNINRDQSEHLIKINGHNPVNVIEIGTAIDILLYAKTSKRKQINTFYQFEQILSRYRNTLISYSVKDVINLSLVEEKNPRPILIGNRKTKPLKNFLNENIIFLQPTRIIGRKRIETGFELIKKLFKTNDFNNRFKETPNLKLTLIITGPIAVGHFSYFEKLIKDFQILLDNISDDVKNKVFIAFLFSEIDKKKFKEKFENPVEIPELYNIASLILLPSKTEGRGLPIIEAAACGVPIFCRKYIPENVYSEVIGKHLSYKERLKVIEFDGKNITLKHLKKITERVFFPHKFIDEVNHNNIVVRNRYSYNSLESNINDILYRCNYQSKYNKKDIIVIKNVFYEFEKLLNCKNKNLEYILNTENREYLPGYGRMKFMIFLKSLIDPSFFRIEEQAIKGIIFSFTQKLFKKNNIEFTNSKKVLDFYNIVENLFNYKKGKNEIRHDHSLAYRHRNKYNYLYQKYTTQELTGIINIIFHKKFNSKKINDNISSSYFFTDWNLALQQLTSSTYLGIDDRDILIEKLQANIPIAFFPSKYFKNELEFFALQSVRSRLELSIDEELTAEILKTTAKNIEPIYIIINVKMNIEGYSYEQIRNYLINGKDEESKLLYQFGIIKLVESKQPTVGIHFKLLGNDALETLKNVKKNNGVIISTRKDSSIMTDIVDIDRIHIGKADNRLISNVLGIPYKSGFIQFVPAGIRSTLAYPTPIQTAKDFSEFLKSEEFNSAVEKYGKEKVFSTLKKDAETKMSPVIDVIRNLDIDSNKQNNVEYSSISGVYDDKMPWNGIISRTNIKHNNKQLKLLIKSSKKTKTVTSFVNEFEKETNKKSVVAWNGGYILNAELVGKLGLPESYIGSPLGLLISDGKVLSAPLYNKPAIMIYKNGNVNVSRVNCSKGISVSRGTLDVHLPQNQYNMRVPGDKISYYDLLYSNEKIEGNGRVIVKLAGNIIKEVIRTKKNEDVNITPVGLTVSFPADKFPEEFNNVGDEVNIKITGLENVLQAVEAGPLLINNNEYCLDMEIEGWKTKNSIKTQAARLDYTDMRGPKIAVGIDKDNNLVVLTINGRIRESVGATHIDMANILKNYNIVTAMGFDPGGSSTLVVNGKTLNISPYNVNYEENIYSLPPQPRAVSNAVIGYYE